MGKIMSEEKTADDVEEGGADGISSTKRIVYPKEIYPPKKVIGEDVMDEIRDIFERAGIDPTQLAISEDGECTEEVTSVQRNGGIFYSDDDHCAIKDEMFEFSESMYTLMVTSKSIISLPFISAMVVLVIAASTLIFVLLDLLSAGEEGNPFGAPPGVEIIVHVTQFIAILIGWLMEEEIPTGIQMLTTISQKNLEKETPYSYRHVVFSACCRIGLGYIYLLCMFVIVVQAEQVLDLFFNLLALQFIESLDDVVFTVVKKGIFGSRLSGAANCHKNVQLKLRSTKSSSEKRCKFILWSRAIYFLNLVVLYICFIIITKKQSAGYFQCKSLSISFEEHIWGDALVKGKNEKRVLMYSFFSGTYKLDATEGKAGGRPVYVEHNKKDGTPFQEKEPAKFMYCDEEEAWVFVHDKIIRHEDERENPSKCPWLLKSPKTTSFDLASVPLTGWSLWVGAIAKGESLTITCDECELDADCNFNGKCDVRGGDSVCECNEKEYFGKHCEFDYPCESLRDNEGNMLSLVETDTEPPFATSYGRPIYQGTINEHDNELKGGTHYWRLGLVFSGNRWFGTRFSAKSVGDIRQSFMELHSREFHGFWDTAYDQVPDNENIVYDTNLISNPTYGNDPIGVDFNRISFKGGDFTPFGLLTLIAENPGQGFFHCEEERCENMKKGWKDTSDPFNTCEIEFDTEISCIDSVFGLEEKKCVCSNGEVLMKKGFFCHLDAEYPSTETTSTADEEDFAFGPSFSPTSTAIDIVTKSPAGGGRRLSDTAENDSCLGMEQGDVAIVGMRSDNPSTIVLIALQDLLPGGSIYMTTNTWMGIVFKSKGGTKKLNIPSSGIAAGTVFGYDNDGTSSLLLATSWTIESGPTVLLESEGGILIYCIDAEAKPSFLFAASDQSDTQFAGTSVGAYVPNRSKKYHDLPSYCVVDLVAGFGSWRYVGIKYGTKMELLGGISNSTNWAAWNSPDNDKISPPYVVVIGTNL